MKIRFFLNRDKSEAVEAYRRLKSRAEKQGLREIAGGTPEAVISLGGDGTILRAVREFPGVPVLGLNLGGLGYLASVGRRDFGKALRLLARGEYAISERSLLAVDGKYRALNDIAITRELSGHTVRLDLEADGRLVAHYLADGLIFATPTGSTAYSLAAGGPVLMPDAAGVVVTPVNPHALGVRPVVMRDEVRFRVSIAARTTGNPQKAGVYADGERILTLREGRSITITKASTAAKLVQLKGYNPYEVLANKLGWSGSNVK